MAETENADPDTHATAAATSPVFMHRQNLASLNDTANTFFSFHSFILALFSRLKLVLLVGHFQEWVIT